MNVIDIETYEDNGKLIPYCICSDILNIKKEYYGDNNILKEFIFDILNIETDRIEVYVHNINFDGLLLIEQLGILNIKFEVNSVNTNIYWLKIYYIKKIITFRCSYKILPISLRKIGEIENEEKLYFPYKFVNKKNLYYIGDIPDLSYWEDERGYIENKKKETFDLKKKTIEYCHIDVKILKKCLLNLLKVISSIDKSVISSSFSSPSMSFNIFNRKFNYKKIEKKISIKDDQYIRSSYYGGRCEVFGNIYDDEYIKYYDFKGMYAQSMKEKFHIGNGRFSSNNGISEIGFHTISFLSNSSIPILPMHSASGKLIFPNGRITGTYWHEEIKYFLENGGKIIEHHHSYLYNKEDYVFIDFVSFFEEIREKGGYFNIFGKLMINSLYGSMGLKNEKTYTYITYSLDEYENIIKNLNVKKFYKINNIYLLIIIIDYKFKKNMKNSVDIYSSNRNVSYASAISSKARIKLHKFFRNVEKDGGRVLYCDTDSIFAAYNKKNKDEKIIDEKWIDFYNDGVFVSPKTYAVINNNNYIIKIKGISKKEININEIKNNFYQNNSIRFTQQKITSKNTFTLNERTIEKTINMSKYDKRTFNENKKTTTPIIINTLD